MELSKLILTAKIILLTSVVCDNLNDGASAVVPENLCFYFRCCSDCFLSEHAALLEGTGQAGAYKEPARNLSLIPSARFCPSVLGYWLSW